MKNGSGMNGKIYQNLYFCLLYTSKKKLLLYKIIYEKNPRLTLMRR